MKVCILKPIMWNTKNYIKPSGHKSSGGYSKDKGFGHEEWNNNPNWIWRDFKVFHTESETTPKLSEFAKEGNLGILMIASFEKKQFAVGIATNVYKNDNEEMQLIADELKIIDNDQEIWDQKTVKECFNNDFETFKKFWENDYKWIGWKCPKENYHWFKDPILLDANKISGKNRLIGMHGRYQCVLPQTILDITYNQLGEKPAILDWLTNGEFDDDLVKFKSTVQSNVILRKKYPPKGKNATTANPYSYWIEGQRNIAPLHAKLQAKFVKYLFDVGITYKEDKDYIDVQYYQDKKLYYSEIKPTENIGAKYSIRMAIGQIFEYQFFNNKAANLEIVLSSRPNKKK